MSGWGDFFHIFPSNKFCFWSRFFYAVKLFSWLQKSFRNHIYEGIIPWMSVKEIQKWIKFTQHIIICCTLPRLCAELFWNNGNNLSVFSPKYQKFYSTSLYQPFIAFSYEIVVIVRKFLFEICGTFPIFIIIRTCFLFTKIASIFSLICPFLKYFSTAL